MGIGLLAWTGTSLPPIRFRARQLQHFLGVKVRLVLLSAGRSDKGGMAEGEGEGQREGTERGRVGLGRGRSVTE